MNIQWGINIPLLRPYVFAAPYIRYAVFKTPEHGMAGPEPPGLRSEPGGRSGDMELQVSGKYREFWVLALADRSISIPMTGSWTMPI